MDWASVIFHWQPGGIIMSVVGQLFLMFRPQKPDRQTTNRIKWKITMKSSRTVIWATPTDNEHPDPPGPQGLTTRAVARGRLRPGQCRRANKRQKHFNERRWDDKATEHKERGKGPGITMLITCKLKEIKVSQRLGCPMSKHFPLGQRKWEWLGLGSAH